MHARTHIQFICIVTISNGAKLMTIKGTVVPGISPPLTTLIIPGRMSLESRPRPQDPECVRVLLHGFVTV